MDEGLFREVVEQEWANVPPLYQGRIDNVALLIEDEPSPEIKLLEGEELLGIYQGIPLTERGVGYGEALPDTITIYRLPTLLEAQELQALRGGEFIDVVRKVVKDTIWHEIGHYFGYDDAHIHLREDEGTNVFRPT